MDHSIKTVSVLHLILKVLQHRENSNIQTEAETNMNITLNVK